MKKFFVSMLAVVASLGIAEQSFAASNINTFSQGDLGINVVFNLGSLNDESMFGGSASAEYGILEGLIKGKGSIGVGGQLGFGKSSGDKYVVSGTTTQVKNTVFRIATRGVFHYQFIPQLDTYAGLSCGIVDHKKYKTETKVAGGATTDVKVTDNDFIFAPFIGVRYMFSSNFGLTSELSIDEFSYFAFGVTFKL